eukprot:TRINITY_DN2919_c0_g1_i1.p1 TRINITY_DN2919_c0_g1~~TRINITY_DN2919_c0_g1_i1.p1  ORF type:complete len:313 (-),score=81.41 TRINITY_DN2919_c0_g1_i1:12-950(-)
MQQQHEGSIEHGGNNTQHSHKDTANSSPPTQQGKNNNVVEDGEDTTTTNINTDGEGDHELKRRESMEQFMRINSERVVLNVGGRIFETYVQTLMKLPDSLLGVMFSDRNRKMRKPDPGGVYFFDRNPSIFEVILEFYRTDKINMPPGITKRMMKDEFDFWMIDTDILSRDESFGFKLAQNSLRKARKKMEGNLDVLKKFIITSTENAAADGQQYLIMEFKPIHQDFYSFLSNFSHRELLLHDLLGMGLDVSFSGVNSGLGHSYILNIVLWDRFTTQKVEDSLSACKKILAELRMGVEVKTEKTEHIISIHGT